MNEDVDIRISRVPGVRDVVLREQAFVILSSDSADARVETKYPLISRIPPPEPEVTSACDKTRTWTFSGSHMTGSNGAVDIHLNKFLECIPAAIDGVIYSNFIGSRPHFAATAETDEPVFVTYTIRTEPLEPPQGQVFLPQAWDVTVSVRTWKHDGTPAPNVEFSWIAIADTASVTNF